MFAFVGMVLVLVWIGLVIAAFVTVSRGVDRQRLSPSLHVTLIHRTPLLGALLMARHRASLRRPVRIRSGRVTKHSLSPKPRPALRPRHRR